MRSRIKQYCTHALTDLTYESTFINTPEHIHLLPSILVPQTSYPLISLNRSNKSNRLPNWSFLLAIKRKLRLPIFNTEQLPKCPCGRIHDAWGDHAFNCKKHNKKQPHNFIRDCWAPALQSALALTGHLAPSSSLEIEKQNLPISDPSARPFDLSFDPDHQPTQEPKRMRSSTSFHLVPVGSLQPQAKPATCR